MIASLALMVFAFAIGQFLGRNQTTGTGDQSAADGPQVTTGPSAPATSTDGGSAFPTPSSPTDDGSVFPAPTVPTDDTAGNPAPTVPTDDGSGTSASTAPAPTAGAPTAEPTTVPEPQIPTTPQSDDLGLAVPISQPSCDGRWIVLVGATTTPGQYAAGVGTLLQSHPGAQYMLTQGSCSSLRQSLPDGSAIYAVYFGPFSDAAAACAKRTEAGDRAYVKLLDNSTPPERPWNC
jgi:serine/threonine-protein kinase